jgi:hypothetical protein
MFDDVGVLRWATNEFWARNKINIRLERRMKSFTEYVYVITYTSHTLDAIQQREAKALAAIAIDWAKRNNDIIDPGRGLFTSVGLASVERSPGRLRAIPWWRRLFTAEPSVPPDIPIDIVNELVQVRQINSQLLASKSGASLRVYQAPIRNGLDLSHVFAQSYPLTNRQTLAATARGIMSPERPVLIDVLSMQLINTAWDVAHWTGLTLEQHLAIAIAQRNSLVGGGRSKVLLAAWNEEIKQLLWIMKRTPM